MIILCIIKALCSSPDWTLKGSHQLRSCCTYIKCVLGLDQLTQAENTHWLDIISFFLSSWASPWVTWSFLLVTLGFPFSFLLFSVQCSCDHQQHNKHLRMQLVLILHKCELPYSNPDTETTRRARSLSVLLFLTCTVQLIIKHTANNDDIYSN